LALWELGDGDDAEDEMRRTQKNKATEGHLGSLKAKLAKLRTEVRAALGWAGLSSIADVCGLTPGLLRGTSCSKARRRRAAAAEKVGRVRRSAWSKKTRAQ
jgi:hypothetical protein